MLLKAQVTRRFVLAALLALPLVPGLRAQTPPAFANFEGAQTNPIRLSADGTRLFAVNTPNASVSVFDVTTPGSPTLIAEIPVGLEPVSVNPLTDDVAWVVNQVSNSVSIVSVSKGAVIDTIQVKPEPMDVVFTPGGQAFVSVSRTNQVAVIDTSTHQSSRLDLFGGNPRALAVSPDGKTVYVAFALSGNATTMIPSTLAPPQCTPTFVPPINPLLPPPPQVGLIVAASNTSYPSFLTYQMPDNDVAVISTGSSPAVTRYYSGVGTINLGLAVNPSTGDIFVANTDARNLIFFEPNLRGHWVDNRITRIQVATDQVTPFPLNPNINYGVLPNPAALATSLAQPTAVVFDPSGNFMYVAAFGTDRVAQVNTNGQVSWFVEVSPPSGSGSNADPPNKRGPRGLALNAGAQTLYCLNRISNTISVINTSTKTVSSEILIGNDPTPSVIKLGRGFLYDAKLSGNGTGACASCHVDADMDHLAWNLGDPGGSMTTVVQFGKTIQFHPMKGPMTTQTLRGLLNLSPYHWRGDKVNFAAFNAAFVSLMGGNQISTSAMNAYTNFINTILFLPNPNENPDRTLPTSFEGGNPAQGEVDFMTVKGSTSSLVTCAACHTANPGPGSNRVIELQQQPQPLKTPQLRNMYQKQLYDRFAPKTIDGFGMDHEGHVSLFKDFFSSPIFHYNTTQEMDMSAYMLCFDTGTAPAVGFTQTLTSANVSSSQAQSNWATLQSQAAAGNIDLIARGIINNAVVGLLYQASTNNYITNTSGLGPYTQAQLQSLIQHPGGSTILSFMGVYPGTGSVN
jgi:YVTN family beta-propeller protein